MARSDNYITAVREVNKQIWDGIHTLVALQSEYQALDYGSTLPDGSGSNEGYTRDEIEAVVLTTANAFVGLLDAGHGTNMAKLL